MESTDRELLLEINGRLVRMEERMTRMEYRQETLEMKQDMLQTTVYWGFAILGVIAAFVPLFRRDKKDPPAPPQTPIIVYPPRIEDIYVRAPKDEPVKAG